MQFVFTMYCEFLGVQYGVSLKFIKAEQKANKPVP